MESLCFEARLEMKKRQETWVGLFWKPMARSQGGQMGNSFRRYSMICTNKGLNKSLSPAPKHNIFQIPIPFQPPIFLHVYIYISCIDSIAAIYSSLNSKSSDLRVHNTHKFSQNHVEQLRRKKHTKDKLRHIAPAPTTAPATAPPAAYIATFTGFCAGTAL